VVAEMPPSGILINFGVEGCRKGAGKLGLLCTGELRLRRPFDFRLASELKLLSAFGFRRMADLKASMGSVFIRRGGLKVRARSGQ